MGKVVARLYAHLRTNSGGAYVVQRKPQNQKMIVSSILAHLEAAAESFGQNDLLAEIESRTTALTITEVASLFRVSGETIRRMVAKRTIPAFRIGGSIRFSPATLGYWLRQRDPLAAKASRARNGYQTA
jgi:excisionase family DNA binding protein